MTAAPRRLARQVLVLRLMHSITPCQRKISDRFPVASFVVNVPPSRLFEIVCTTDPRLLKPEARAQRTAQNFFTSRGAGLLRAPAGHATYLVPPEQLRRFAGRPRLYFALASYGNPRGEDPRLSISPASAEQTPSIQLSADFTGRTLDRSRVRGGPRGGTYGAAAAPVLTWGGDAMAARPLARAAAASDYDDGFSPDLWRGRGAEEPEPLPLDDAPDPPEPEPSNEEMGLSEAYGRPLRALGEPAGFEDAPAMRAAYGGVGATAASVEPPGAEDGLTLRRSAPTYGRGAPATALDEPPGIEDLQSRLAAPTAAAAPAPAAAPTASAADVPGRGVDDAWAEEDDEPDLVSTATAVDGEPLTIRKKFEILLPVADLESGALRYGATLGSVEHDDPAHPAYQRVHHGLHWGILLFTQRSGLVGQVLRAFERRDAARMKQAFGAAIVDRLLRVTGAESPDARLAPVGDARLWTSPWVEIFREAGKLAPVQAAQNEVAIEHYLDRNLGFATAIGFDTDRALGILLDRSVNMGLLGGRRWVLDAVSPLVDDAKRAAALTALGHADLAAFQQASGLVATGRLGTATHAALLAALRALGDRRPFALPAVPEMVDRMVTAAAGRRFEARIKTLRSSAAYTDAVQRVI